MGNLFDIDDLLKGEGGKYLGYGIHTNVAVTTVERGKSPKGNVFVKIEFSKDGSKISKTLWQPKGEYPQDGETSEDAKLREERENLRIIAALLKIFLSPEEKESFPKLEYDKFIDKAIAVLTPKLKYKTVNIKVVYDSKGEYTELSRYDAIEAYVEGEEPTIKFSDWELQNRSTRKAEKKKMNNDMEKLLSADPFGES